MKVLRNAMFGALALIWIGTQGQVVRAGESDACNYVQCNWGADDCCNVGGYPCSYFCGECNGEGGQDSDTSCSAWVNFGTGGSGWLDGGICQCEGIIG